MKNFNFQFSIFNYPLILLLLVTACHSTRNNDNPQFPDIAVDNTIFSLPPDTLNLTWNSKLDSMLHRAAVAPNDTGLAKLYAEIGEMYKNSDFEKAKEFFQKLRILSEKLNWNEGRYLYASGFSDVLYREGLIDSGLVIIRHAFDLAKKENNERWMARTLMNTGNAFFYKSMYQKALECFLEALPVLEKSGDKATLTKLYDNIGVVYRISGSPDKAIEYHKKALAMFGDEETMIKGTVLYNMATACQLIKADETGYYFKEALRICKLHNSKWVIAAIYGGLANLAADKPDWNEAENYFRQSLDVATEINNPNLCGLAYLGLGFIELIKGNYNQAEKYCKTSIEIAQQIGYAEYQVNAYRQLALIYAARHDFEKSVIFTARADSVENFISREASRKYASEMEAKYETSKKELEIEQQQLLIARKTLQRNLFAAGVAISAVFLALLWYMLRLRTRRNLALTERNNALSEVNATKDKFFNIISHDLKNPVLAQRDALRILAANSRSWDADRLAEYHAELLKVAEEQTELVYNLLGWAQLQTGRITCTPGMFSLTLRLRSDIALLRNMAEYKGIALITNLPDHVLINGDANMLSAVIRNLLINAIKFTAEGGQVTLDVSPCRDVARRVSVGYTISVTDTGVGMTREQIRNLFRLDMSQSRRGTAGEQGSGLGLIVCREFLNQHGATLHVESEPGKGSRFWFEV